MIVAVIRQEQHTYAQGLPAQFSKFRRFDFHWPEMEHLGFTPTYNSEIYMTGVENKDNGVFNYRPIFQEYRYERDEACGILILGNEYSTVGVHTPVRFSPITSLACIYKSL